MGLQYQVENFMEIVPRTKEGILGYLSCGSVRVGGQKLQRRFTKNLALIRWKSWRNIPGASEGKRNFPEKAEGDCGVLRKNKVFRELMTFLAPYKVTPKKVNLILQKFRNESVEIVRHRPYQLCAVKGLAF